MATKRDTQLDGWRAAAVLGVMWLHFTPAAWHARFPFEIGLFYFLTLTGFLISGALLRVRDSSEGSARWRRTAYGEFMSRRFARILLPCYVAMVYALAVGASDIRAHWVLYFSHLVNFHIAMMPGWPSGTAHYWTLALQMQFYVLWPLVIFCCPHKWIGTALWVMAVIAPMSRWLFETRYPGIHHAQCLTICAFDYFGIGGWLAWRLHNGARPGDRVFGRVALAGFVGYVALYTLREAGREVGPLAHIQQTLLAVAMAGLISRTLAGFTGGLGRVLDHRATQHVAKISYALYLFHTPTPLLLGWVLPQIFKAPFAGALLPLRVLVFFLASWGISWLAWRWLEKPGFFAKRGGGFQPPSPPKPC